MAHGHGPHEEAEHASHHAHDPFDKRVALTMVVIAALLAAVKVLGHRTHNDTLSYQIKAGAAHSEANVHHTLETDQWNFYQAKKMRQHMYESQSEMLASLTPEDRKSDPAIAKKLKDWGKQARRYKEETKEIMAKAEAEHQQAKEYREGAVKYRENSDHKHHQSAFFDLGELGVELALVLSSVAILSKRPPFWYSGMAVGALGLVVVACGFFVH
jgi:hypothetical protein